MSRHASRCLSSCGWVVSGVLVVFAPMVAAQTIADYSRAQRTLLENTMTQAAARSAGLGASAPVPAASVATVPPVPAPRLPLPSMTPTVQVSGVFSSSNGAIAEVVVNATPYLLGMGQGVPGTAWHVELVAIDRVVLSRHASLAAAVEAEGPRKVFPLPALR